MEKFIRYARLRNSDFDCNDVLLPSAVLELFQDIAGEHADELNIGYKDLFKKNLIWVIVRTKLEILKNPKAYDNVKLITWPGEPRKIDSDRNYLMVDEKDEIIAKAVSRWVIVDYESRRIVKLKDIPFGDGVFVQEKLFDSLDKLEQIDVTSFIEVKSSYTDLDHNGHVNNTRYPIFMTSAIKELQNKIITSMQIEYVKEIPANSTIKIGYITKGNSIYVKGYVGEELSFYSLIEVK